MIDAGTEIGASLNRRVQVRKSRAGHASQAKRKRFLDHLAATCNVTASCESAGMTVRTLYLLRKRDPDFAGLWREALAMGYERLEAALLANVTKAVNDITIEPLGGDPLPAGKGALGALTYEQVRIVLAVLGQHRRAATEGGTRVMRAQPATMEETDALLRKRLDALAARMRAPAA